MLAYMHTQVIRVRRITTGQAVRNKKRLVSLYYTQKENTTKIQERKKVFNIIYSKYSFDFSHLLQSKSGIAIKKINNIISLNFQPKV